VLTNVPRACLILDACVAVRTSNIARESALAAGFSQSVPAHTVTMACISANQALASGASMIQAGQADVVVAGGAETMSDVPIRFSKALRQRLIKASRMKSIQQVLPLLKGLKLKDLAPEAPAIAEVRMPPHMCCPSLLECCGWLRVVCVWGGGGGGEVAGCSEVVHPRVCCFAAVLDWRGYGPQQ